MVKAGIDVLCVDTGSDGYPVYINDAKGHGVAMMDGPLERRREDAAKLVHRFNMHEELVEALEQAKREYEMLYAEAMADTPNRVRVIDMVYSASKAMEQALTLSRKVPS